MSDFHGVVEGGAAAAGVDLSVVNTLLNPPRELVGWIRILRHHEAGAAAIRGTVRVGVAKVGGRDTVPRLETDANRAARRREAVRRCGARYCGGPGRSRVAISIVSSVPGRGLRPIDPQVSFGQSDRLGAAVRELRNRERDASEVVCLRGDGLSCQVSSVHASCGDRPVGNQRLAAVLDSVGTLVVKLADGHVGRAGFLHLEVVSLGRRIAKAEIRRAVR